MGDPSLFYNENQNGEIRPMFSYVKFFALQWLAIQNIAKILSLLHLSA